MVAANDDGARLHTPLFVVFCNYITIVCTMHTPVTTVARSAALALLTCLCVSKWDSTFVLSPCTRVHAVARTPAQYTLNVSPLKTRKTYTAKLKLSATECVADHSNQPAERCFNVTEKLTHDWHKAEVTLRSTTFKANRGKKGMLVASFKNTFAGGFWSSKRKAERSQQFRCV